jgi:hypothetical protein
MKLSFDKAGLTMWPGPLGGGSRKSLLANLDQSSAARTRLRRYFYSERPIPTPLEETLLRSNRP